MSYLGDYLLGATVDFKWSTNDANGASITRSTDGTISVYKGNNVTQRTAEIADTEDFDSLTGVHHCSVMTTNDTFYTIGEDYQIVLSASTINAQTVNSVIGQFSIQNRSSSLDTISLANLITAATNYSATRGLSGTALPAVAAGSAGGLPDDTDSNGAVRIVDGTGAREINTNSGAVALVDLVTTTTTNTDVTALNDVAATDIVSSGAITTSSGAVVITTNVTNQVTADVTQLGGVTQSLTDLKDFADAGYDPGTNKVQGVVLVDTTTTNTDMVGTDSAALASVCTETRLSELDAATGGKMANQIDIIETDTTSLNDTKIPNTLNTTASGNIGIDWANVENPTTALDLSATDIQLVDTVTTYTGNTKQTGDVFLQIGHAGVGLTAITDVSAPTATQIVDEWETQSQADPTGFHVNVMEVNGTSQTANDIGADSNTLVARGDSYLLIGNAGVGLTHLAESSICTDTRLSELDSANIPTDIDSLTTQIGTAGDGLTAINLPNQTMDISGNITGNLSGSVGSVTGAVGSVAGNVDGNVTGSVGSLTGHTAQTGDNYVRLGHAGVGLTHLAESSICNETRLVELDSANLPSDVDSLVVGTITNAQGADVATDVAGMIDGNNRVDVGFWLGTAVTLGSGAPDVNIQSTDDIDLSATQKTSVNAEVDTALVTTTYTEPGQGIPAATASIKDKLSYMYKFMRNKITNDGTSVRVYDDAGTTIDQLSTISSVGGTVTRGEFGTGI